MLSIIQTCRQIHICIFKNTTKSNKKPNHLATPNTDGQTKLHIGQEKDLRNTTQQICLWVLKNPII